ncbi:lactonase family protein [Natronoglycomyces albus]|uniref:Lactonase family protein n=1 Tax=Natronoglycomyces albus TaxID=2811108 RepID=A0A895XU63_9ACTN|nr:beta-propeller fold lactonase family protein [Natronoglycomyces albus]QSB06839.1 lactonase family protein [Natronoglycomyces albus]
MRYVIGSYTTAGGPGLALATGDTPTQPLSVTVADPGPVNPSWVALGSSDVVYTVSEVDDGTVSAWRFAGDSWVPVGQSQSSGGSAPCHAVVYTSGSGRRWLVVANYGSGEVAALPIAADESLGPASSIVRWDGSGPNQERQLAPHAHQVVVDPSGRWLWVCDLGSDSVKTLELDAESGQLQVRGSAAFPAGSGPRHLAVVSSDTVVVVGELSREVFICDVEATDGAVALRSTVSIDMEIDGTDYPSAVVPAPDGRTVYVTSRGSDQVWVIDVDTHEVRRRLPSGGAWPRAACLSREDDNLLLVTCERSGYVSAVDLTGHREPQMLWQCPGVSDIHPF